MAITGARLTPCAKRAAAREAVALGLDALRLKGRLVVFAPIPGETPVDIFQLLLRELEIVGSVNDPGLMDEAIAALSRPSPSATW